MRVQRDWTEVQKRPTEENQRELNGSLEGFKAFSSAIGTVATIATGIVLYLNFRVANKNARIANRNANIANKNLKLAEAKLDQDTEKNRKDAEIAESRLITDRFSKAVEQLGSNQTEVCLGGIYALERIAKDSRADYWTIMEVLTSFVYSKSPLQNLVPSQVEYSSAHSLRAAELYNQQPITLDIKAALTVIGRRKTDHDPLDENLVINLRNCNLCGFSLKSAQFPRAILNNVYWGGVFLEEANFANAELCSTNFRQAQLKKAIFKKANLTEANLDFAVLEGADLSGSIVEGTKLHHADFKNAILTEAKLFQANLASANLREADLSSADLTCAILFDADLSRANFSGTNLYCTNLKNARGWTDEQLSQAQLCKTMLPSDSKLDPNRDCERLGIQIEETPTA